MGDFQQMEGRGKGGRSSLSCKTNRGIEAAVNEDDRKKRNKITFVTRSQR